MLVALAPPSPSLVVVTPPAVGVTAPAGRDTARTTVTGLPAEGITTKTVSDTALRGTARLRRAAPPRRTTRRRAATKNPHTAVTTLLLTRILTAEGATIGPRRGTSLLGRQPMPGRAATLGMGTSAATGKHLPTSVLSTTFLDLYVDFGL